MKKFLLSALTVILLTATCVGVAISYEGPRSEIRKVLAEAVVSSVLIHGLQELRAKEQPKVCDFFGYRIDCIRRPISAYEWKTLKKRVMKLAPVETRLLSKFDGPHALDDNFWRNAVSSGDVDFVNVVPIFVAGKVFPGYVPYVGYNGMPSEFYKKLSPEGLNTEDPNSGEEGLYQKWVEGYGWYDIPKTKIDELNPIEISASDFERFLSIPKDSYGEIVFGNFAELKDVIEGRRVYEFWIKYVEYSKRVDLTKCADGCSSAAQMNSKRDKISSIALCTVTRVRGWLARQRIVLQL